MNFIHALSDSNELDKQGKTTAGPTTTNKTATTTFQR